LVASNVDVAAAAGLITPTGTAKSIKAKVAEIRKAVEAGDRSRAAHHTDALLKDLDARRDRGVSSAVVDVISEVLLGGIPPSTVAVPVGASSVVATDADSIPVVVTLPAGTGVSWMRIVAAPSAGVARPSGTSRVSSIEISAFDSFGRAVTQLGASAQISIGFRSSTAVNAASARISTIGSAGGTEILSTQVTSGVDAYTAKASTTHFTPFVVDALTTTPPWRFTYVAPPTITGISPSTGARCGNSTIVLTGSGLSGTVSPGVGGTLVQSFTVDSDTQVTLLSSVGNSSVLNSVNVTKYLTSTALAPEFANTGIDFGDPMPVYRNSMSATAGADSPGTPSFTTVTPPMTPRVTGLTPNQGPTISAPAHPSQYFINSPIRITGCGFTGATAVLFGATPSPSFTVQDDTIIFATPPTPGSGTLDIRVVTPLGTSSIIP
jgi:hypothetical protein